MITKEDDEEEDVRIESTWRMVDRGIRLGHSRRPGAASAPGPERQWRYYALPRDPTGRNNSRRFGVLGAACSSSSITYVAGRSIGRAAIQAIVYKPRLSRSLRDAMVLGDAHEAVR